MVPVQDLRGALEVEPVAGGLGPGKVGHRLQVGAHDLVFRRFPGNALDPAELPLHLLRRLGREVEGREPLPKLLDLLRFDVLPELLPDRLHLLAEEDLPLSLAQLLLDLRADLLLSLEQPDLSLQVKQQLAQPVLHGERLQQLLLLVGLELGVEGHEVGQLAGARDAAQQVVDDLLRDASEATQLGRALPDLLVEAGERRLVGIEGPDVLEPAAHDLQQAVPNRVLESGGARHPLDHELDAAGDLLHLGDTADRAHRVERLRDGILGLGVLLGHGEEQLVVLHGRFDRLQRLFAPRRDRRRNRGEHDRAPQRDHGEMSPVPRRTLQGRIPFGLEGVAVRLRRQLGVRA